MPNLYHTKTIDEHQLKQAIFDQTTFAEKSSQSESLVLAHIQHVLEHATLTLQNYFKQNIKVAHLLRARSWLIDQLLIFWWQQHPWPQSLDLDVIAVGGYGREELYPHSDIDLFILHNQTEIQDKTKTAIISFISKLWDLGLTIRHNVYSVEQCIKAAADDDTIFTTLLTARCIHGSSTLLDTLLASLKKRNIWPSQQFYQAKMTEQYKRHKKYSDTAYHIEPNIKHSPGGLRDLHLISWIANRQLGASTLFELIDFGLIKNDEYQMIEQGHEVLASIRFALHTLTDRDENRLLLDYQSKLSELFEFKDDQYHLGIEKFMKCYFKTIKQLNELNSIILQLLHNQVYNTEHQHKKIIPINNDFQICNDFLQITRPDVFDIHPPALLEIFLLLAKHHQKIEDIEANTIRSLKTHYHLINDKFHKDKINKQTFLKIISHPTGIIKAFKAMNQYGMLAAYLPAFDKIVGQMQYDLFHAYTVDTHIIFVMENIYRFTLQKEFPHFQKCTEIMQKIKRPELLYIAALFHDIAKGRGGNHSTLGMVDAKTFCIEHHLNADDTDLIVWLVEQHLLMSSTAQRKDINDLIVIHNFASQVKYNHYLDHLYALTVADISATNPSLWTQWKGTLLNQLYVNTQLALNKNLSHLETKLILTDNQRKQAAELLEKHHNISKKRIDLLWNNFFDDYFSRYSIDDIVWQSYNIITRHKPEMPLVLAKPHHTKNATEVFIYTQRNDLLFSSVTNLFDKLHASVASAHIITTKDNFSLDQYTILQQNGRPFKHPKQTNIIQSKLTQYLMKSVPEPINISRHVPREVKHFSHPTKIKLSYNRERNFTVMEVTTPDRPGLLAQISLALMECNVLIINAMINTMGENVEDIFYITDKMSQPIKSEEEFKKIHDKVCLYIKKMGI